MHIGCKRLNRVDKLALPVQARLLRVGHWPTVFAQAKVLAATLSCRTIGTGVQSRRFPRRQKV
jgi:hypothetical protein